VLIAAASGRALAASARRGGYLPLVADCFGDQDTQALADRHVLLDGDSTLGMDGERILQALATLAEGRDPAGLVYGTGFEDRPELLAAIGNCWTLLGNSPATVRCLKTPLDFAELCRRCGIPHPAIVVQPPADPTGWLRKRVGGSGGSHIRPADRQAATGPNVYFQREVAGAPVSALVLAAGGRAVLLGFSTQWSAAAPDRPYRYGGAVRPAALPAGMAVALTDCVRRLAAAVPICGLNSMDFVVNDDQFWLLEVNPRPGATLDIFELTHDSLFALHLAACEGRLPAKAAAMEGAMASAIVYAERDVEPVPAVDWPDWTADHQRPGTSLRAGDPVCTVLARAPDASAARALAERRRIAMLALTTAGRP
jgi:predicted ATP-grasp superfamily ATP-dependent carboligase